MRRPNLFRPPPSPSNSAAKLAGGSGSSVQSPVWQGCSAGSSSRQDASVSLGDSHPTELWGPPFILFSCPTPLPAGLAGLTWLCPPEGRQRPSLAINLQGRPRCLATVLKYLWKSGPRRPKIKLDTVSHQSHWSCPFVSSRGCWSISL